MRERVVVADAVRTASGVVGDALLIRDGVIAEAGSAATLATTDIPTQHYPGHTIVPGLRDAHFHPVTYAAAVTGTTLKEAADFADLAERLQDAAAGLEPGVPLVALRLLTLVFSVKLL